MHAETVLLKILENSKVSVFSVTITLFKDSKDKQQL